MHPGKGSAVLFYNLLEDGNGDDLALHAALPVEGSHEKLLVRGGMHGERDVEGEGGEGALTHSVGSTAKSYLYV